MGLAVNGSRLAIAVRQKILVFRNRLPSPTDSRDAKFECQDIFTTGKVNAHDVAFGRRGVYFANTKFNCIARGSRTHSFAHCWQPHFLSQIVRKDRCHLNGVGLRHGKPSVATAFCATEHAGGWRELNRLTSGVLLDVGADRIIADGLCMPHSPRWHDGHWWLCNSGHGTLARVDPNSGQTDQVGSLPGFTRGLTIVDNHALVGLSKIRRKHILDAPPVREKHGELLAGVALVNLTTAMTVGILEFVQGGNEVFEVVFLPKIRQPDLIVPKLD